VKGKNSQPQNSFAAHVLSIRYQPCPSSYHSNDQLNNIDRCAHTCMIAKGGGLASPPPMRTGRIRLPQRIKTRGEALHSSTLLQLLSFSLKSSIILPQSISRVHHTMYKRTHHQISVIIIIIIWRLSVHLTDGPASLLARGRTPCPIAFRDSRMVPVVLWGRYSR